MGSKWRLEVILKWSWEFQAYKSSLRSLSTWTYYQACKCHYCPHEPTFRRAIVITVHMNLLSGVKLSLLSTWTYFQACKCHYCPHEPTFRRANVITVHMNLLSGVQLSLSAMFTWTYCSVALVWLTPYIQKNTNEFLHNSLRNPVKTECDLLICIFFFKRMSINVDIMWINVDIIIR